MKLVFFCSEVLIDGHLSHCPLFFALLPQKVVHRESYGVTRELPSGLWLGVT